MPHHPFILNIFSRKRFKMKTTRSALVGGGKAVAKGVKKGGSAK
jgi:hypothetical protein